MSATPESDEYWALVQELHRRGEPEIFRAASTWCFSDDSAMRCLGADVLGQLGYPESFPFGDESSAILSGLLQDEDPAVVSAGLIALGHLGRGAASRIASLASHSDARVRYAVAVCLGPRPEDDATRTLIALTKDDDRDVRDWATFGLGDMSDADSPDVRAALVARLVDLDEEVRGEALVGLANRGVKDVTPAILEELRLTGSVLAVRAAGILGDSVFVPELERLLATTPTQREVRAALARCSRG
jgi:HEAT repeat protein